MSTPVIITVTVALLVASAFFVMVEFALLGVRRHRFEEQASHSITARAVLRGVDELTLMLAAAQLGITACTFALGAVTKPAVADGLRPLIGATGLSGGAVYGVTFMLALGLVTFLHLVIGEMAPKSWAIAFPERAARLVAVPARMTAWLLRPILLWMNRTANTLVRWSGVEPVDRAAVGGHDATTLRHLVEHSADAGVLGAESRARIVGALDLVSLRLKDLPDAGIPALPLSATVREVQQASYESEQLRILIRDREGIAGVIHVRDTLAMVPSESVAGILRPLLRLDPEISLLDALHRMREQGVQVAGIDGGQRCVTLNRVLASVTRIGIRGE